MTSISAPQSPATPSVPTHPGTTEVSQTAAPAAAGAAAPTTGAVPAEVGNTPGSTPGTPGKPDLPAPKMPFDESAKVLAKAHSRQALAGRHQADQTMSRADILREIRKQRREAACAKSFELQDFARLVLGPVKYCITNPGTVVATALAASAAVATALTTGSLAGFKAAMPSISAVMTEMVKSSGVQDMLESGAELVLLQLGVDPTVTEKWGDAVGSAAFLSANVAMNALGGTWSAIDFSTMGDLAADVAALMNMPAKNAAALKGIVQMLGHGTVAIGAGIAAGSYKDLNATNFKSVWDELMKQFSADDAKFNLNDFLKGETFEKMSKAWTKLTQDFGNLQSFVQALSDLASPAAQKNYKA